jgi:hypothetical protein
MRVTYEGKEYSFDLEEITVAQARTIKTSCGLSLMALENGLTEGDADALRAVFWLMLCQNGENADIDRVDFKIVKFARAIDEAATAKDDPGPKAGSAKSSPA